MPQTGRQLRSLIGEDGILTLSLEDVTVPQPGDDELVVRVEATPINPSDLRLLFGPADVASARTGGDAGRQHLIFDVAQERLASVEGRLGCSLAVGGEGAGTVVAAGKNATEFIGHRVGMWGGAMYADYRCIRRTDVIVLPDGTDPADGASMFVNPLTALGFVETARSEGHGAIVHTAAASNLGQMLQKICLADGIPLINIVRSPAQVERLRAIGARDVLDSEDAQFKAKLAEALERTGATIVFDPIGGGSLGSTIMQTMEEVAVRRLDAYDRYGSSTLKQLYVYGSLDPAPMSLNRVAFGFRWSVGGWLLFHFLTRAGETISARLKKRVLDELTTTFASSYTRVIGFSELLDPDILRACNRKATGEKFLIDPSRG